AHATLIDYPLNLDPKTGKPCAPELLIERLEAGAGKRRWRLKVLAKLQGHFASYAHLWR
ncbi:MAG: capsular polysaccharide biosynthesis protein, partial [Rhodobacteraceae bacterium]|nr:capsular polysaccharide biosynthesis protein [Paracoccaceae bacterium]